MRVLVTGAHGQLGLEVAKQFRQKYELVLHDVDTLDISDYSAVIAAVKKIKPDIVINTAAYTNVDKSEDEPHLAFKANAAGPHNLAIACKRQKAKLVHISTDYVFDGTNSRPYDEADQTNPISVYGKSKLLGERLIQQHGGCYFILRTSWLYGDGRNFVQTMLRLAEQQKEVSVVADQYGTPTYTKDLVWIIEKLMLSEAYGLYHASNNGFCSWYEFAKEIFAITGKHMIVKPLRTDEYPTIAQRPLYSVLENHNLKLRDWDVMRPWHEALEDYLQSFKTIKTSVEGI